MALLLFFVFLLASATNCASATDLTTFVYKTCSNNQTLQYHTLQSQTTNLTLNILFTKLVSQSSTTNFFQTTITDITGLYQCRSDLSHTKCNTCVRALTNTIQTSCYTARAQLLGCYMWYELDAYHVDYPPVNRLWHEQCGVLSGTESDFDRYKNRLLNELVHSVGNKKGYYAIRGNVFYDPYVNVLGQCEGDLGVDDCVNCVKTAVDFAQADCGSAFNGDVYLHKCYISYSDGGYHVGGNAGGLMALLVATIAERSKFGAHSTSIMADPGGRNRWSLQEEIAKVFKTSLERTFNPREAVSCSISTCTNDDVNCTFGNSSSVLHIRPELRDTSFRGPKHAGVAVKDNIMASEYKDMMERCVVCGPGFVKFQLCREWIAKNIHKMLRVGIYTWAPKLSVKKAIINSLSPPAMLDDAHMGHLRSTCVGEMLARMLEYSGVVVRRKSIHDGDHLDIEGKSSYDLYISETLDLLRGSGLTIVSEGDETVFIEGRKLPLVYLTALRHALDVDKADWIVHVTDVGKRVY
ncbi:anticodon-binding aminoacyl-tRNA synthetase, class 1a [Tanacetum coccineum]